MDADRLLGQLRAQIANRALVYLAAYDALADAIGAARAEAVLTRAIRLHGRAAGEAFRRFAPADLAGLKDAFLGGLPGGETLFRPELRRRDAGALEVKFQSCPLQQAWQDAGVPEPKRAVLCRIAGAVDLGTFEAAGFGIENRTWTPGATGCCHLTITPGPRA
ncbi:L-2-amino-thiazoline-4-carboxylic acid hydrolase [Elioraea sp.]|uniref:L-2-amino-thiazoline-4-carboxylic acid hydrolase n=1 Tax=Elioraea sp. TaxID=2185103 RepID=UPI003F7078C9